MNDHIERYTREVLQHFVDFLVEFEGSCTGEHIVSIDVRKTNDNGCMDKISMEDFNELIECFLHTVYNVKEKNES
jgi:hypothetical protein